MNKTFKLILGLVTFLFLGIIGYYFFGSKESDTPGIVATNSTTLTREEELTNREFLQLLRSLRSIDLSKNDLVQNPAYTNLSDFSVKLTPENAGRANPFAPFGATESVSPPPSANARTGNNSGAARPTTESRGDSRVNSEWPTDAAPSPVPAF